MEYLQYGKVHAEGELEKRLKLSLTRMEEPLYGAHSIAQKSMKDNAGWPGDWEGRTFLALVMLAKATGEIPPELPGFLSIMDIYTNAEGYMGGIVDTKAVNEQQMAGNSWYLRALCELYEWKKEPEVAQRICRIVENLLLKTQGMYEEYPVTKASRQLGGGREDGFLTGENIDGWLSSTDIGCVFIMLDGASHAYHLLKDPRLYTLLVSMIRRFLSAELVEATFQTHATLSATRGILRFYGDTGEEWLLKEAVRIFALYEEQGMSENYANYNWFQRPEWTEPCAIVDSYLAAMELWRFTRQPTYLDTAHSILYNALYYAQRHNGGFGCDVCVGAHEMTLHPNGAGAYEAWWCCTMRGADGLSNAAAHMAAVDGNTVYLPAYQNGTFTCGGLTLRETTGYPYTGNVELEVIETDGTCQELRLFCPTCVENYQLHLDDTVQSVKKEAGFLCLDETLSVGQKIQLQMELPLYTRSAFTKGFPKAHTLRYGVLELAMDATDGLAETLDPAALTPVGDACFTTPEGRLLRPLTGSTFTSYDEILNTPWQLLFYIQ